KGDFGDEYTSRNNFELDDFYKKQWGITRTKLNQEFLGDVDKEAPLLEVGCNRGMQLEALEKSGFNNLCGIEINIKALKIARNNKSLNLVEGSGFNIPFKDNFFNLVFTSGVLIHISPKDLPRIIDEIYRTTKKYIWCFEYFSEIETEIEYRGENNKLWKNNFLKLFLDRYPNLKVIKQKEIKYVDNDNVDMMFLLEKTIS
ncbi:methyltransferase type 11, partial [Candidatus Pacearchaeota archaeon]|nr:methyltransferase type 11 [Candidatus Pacearchaeota archaeon]